MRVALGFLAYNVVLTTVGMALLYAARLVSLRPWRLAAAVGAAFVCGAATVATLGTVALSAGLTLSALPDTIFLLALAAALGLVGRRRARPADPGGLAPSHVAFALVAVLVVYILLEAALSRHVAPAWDSAHNWYLKAVALGDHASLSGSMLFTDPLFTRSHQTYPLAHPVLGGLLFQYIGNGDAGRLVAQLWILLGATVLAAPFIAGGGRRAWLALLPFGLAAVGQTSRGVLHGDADVPMACFLAIGALALGRWLDDGPDGLLAPAVICLAAAANTKNEGLAFVLGVLAVALVLSVARGRRRAALMVGAGAVAGVLIVPWLLWVHVHGPFGTDVTSLGKSLHGAFLHAHLPILDFTGRQIAGQLTNYVAYEWMFTLAIVLSATVVVAGPARAVAAFYLASLLLAIAALLWVYWTFSEPDPTGHVVRTLPRTMTGPLFLSAAALAHFLPRLASLSGVAPTTADERVAPLAS